MFRAAHRSSSGDSNCICSLWFIYPCGDRSFSRREGSTCFERHTAHHQELKTVFAASRLYTHVVTGRCQGSALTTTGHHMGI